MQRVVSAKKGSRFVREQKMKIISALGIDFKTNSLSLQPIFLKFYGINDKYNITRRFG